MVRGWDMISNIEVTVSSLVFVERNVGGSKLSVLVTGLVVSSFALN